MGGAISELDTDGLLELVNERELDEVEVLQVLRSPFCSVQVAEIVASKPRQIGSHGARELLAGFPGFSFPRALDLLGTLPWLSLLNLAQNPRTLPVVKRQAERKLVSQILTMTLGEKIALARKAHRPLMSTLIALGDGQVVSALLNNPRLVENDILVMLNRSEPPPEFFIDLARHSRWSHYLNVRRALVGCPQTPLPVALSVLVQFSRGELARVLDNPNLPERIRDASQALLEKENRGQRRAKVVKSTSNDGNGGAAQPPEDLR